MRRFLLFLERQESLTVRSSLLRDHVSLETQAALRQASVLRAGAPARAYPCDTSGCAREVLENDADAPTPFVAVCSRRPAECQTVDVGAAELAQVTIVLEPLVDALCRLLAIDAAAYAPLTFGDEPQRLGDQPHQAARRDVFLALRPTAAALSPFLTARERAERGSLVLVPTGSALPLDLPERHAHGAHVEIARLDERLVIRDGALALMPFDAETPSVRERRRRR